MKVGGARCSGRGLANYVDFFGNFHGVPSTPLTHKFAREKSVSRKRIRVTWSTPHNYKRKENEIEHSYSTVQVNESLQHKQISIHSSINPLYSSQIQNPKYVPTYLPPITYPTPYMYSTVYCTVCTRSMEPKTL